MNLPVKHHFNPAFSLQPWTGSDGLLCEMRRINGRVVACRKHPNATGFERNLYRTEGVPAGQEQHLEVNFMRPLDTAADRALKKIMSGDPKPWDNEERSAWTRYILSLIFRNPAAVRVIKDRIFDIWDEGLKALEANYTDQGSQPILPRLGNILPRGGPRQHTSTRPISSLRSLTIRAWVPPS
jgi:hypothetical protein